MPVSRSNRKRCGQCGADVTFAERTRAADGTYRCAPCAATAVDPPIGGPKRLASIDAPDPAAEVDVPPVDDAPTMATIRTAPRRRSSPSAVPWIVGGLVAAGVVVAACVVVIRSNDGPRRATAAGDATVPAGPDSPSPTPASPTGALITLARSASFTRSSDYARLCREADQVTSTLRLDLIGEDSAYRGLSRRSKARRDLLALYVRVRGHCDASAVPDVDEAVRHVIALGDADLIGEGSAIQATASNDAAALALLGVWCRAAGLPGAFDRYERLSRPGGSAGDSAPQAVDGCSDAVMHVLAAIVSARGQARAQDRVDRNRADNAGETSAWRSAMRNEEANLDLLLLTVGAADPTKAAAIRSEATSSTVTDDSALRAHEDYLQGQVDALHWLVSHP